MNQNEHRGGCHCGNLRWTLRSELSLAQLPVRTCGCGFCRKHGLLTTSDPQGEMDFILTNHTAVLRYRFDTETADFLMCGRCGVYVGAQMEEAGRYYAIANLRTLESGDDSEWCSRWITRVKMSVNAVRGALAAGRRCALRCEISMSDKHQTPQSAYHGADLALAQSIAEFCQRPESLAKTGRTTVAGPRGQPSVLRRLRCFDFSYVRCFSRLGLESPVLALTIAPPA